MAGDAIEFTVLLEDPYVRVASLENNLPETDELVALLKSHNIDFRVDGTSVYVPLRQESELQRADASLIVTGPYRVFIPPETRSLDFRLFKAGRPRDPQRAQLPSYWNIYVQDRLDLQLVNVQIIEQVNLRIENCTIERLELVNDHNARLRHCSAGLVSTSDNLKWDEIDSAEFLHVTAPQDKRRRKFLIEAGRYHILLLGHLDTRIEFGRAVEIVYDETILRKWYQRGLKSRESWAGSRLLWLWHFNLIWTTQRKGREFGLTDPDLNRNLINTYVELLKNPSLQSHEIALQRYLAYFRSRNHWLTRLLFLINGGFYRIAVPAVLTVIFLGAILACIWCAGPEYFSKVGELVLNPLKFWSDFVLHKANLSWPLSWPKTIAALLHPALLYLVFSAAVAIKRRFGFPKE